MNEANKEQFREMSRDEKKAYSVAHPFDPVVREWLTGVNDETPFAEMQLTDKMLYANQHPNDPAVRAWLDKSST